MNHAISLDSNSENLMKVDIMIIDATEGFCHNKSFKSFMTSYTVTKQLFHKFMNQLNSV
jgi:hypothetical protein